jgi:hypothetical protein
MKMFGIYICFEMRLQENGIFLEEVFLGWLSCAWSLYTNLILPPDITDIQSNPFITTSVYATPRL